VNYINNAANGICCGFNSTDKIEVAETPVMIDCETGEPARQLYFGFIPGRTYRCENRWMLSQAYNCLKIFETEKEARAAYNELVRKLAETNTVIDI